MSKVYPGKLGKWKPRPPNHTKDAGGLGNSIFLEGPFVVIHILTY